MKLIGRGIWYKSVFVMCDCHTEMIQLYQLEKDDDEFVFSYFGDNYISPKIAGHFEFVMDRGQFLDFVDFVNRAATSPEELIETTYSEKNNDDEEITPVLRLYADEYDCLTIERIDIANNKESVLWEIIVDSDRTKELAEELNSWGV